MPNSTIRLTRLYLVILFALCMPLYGFAQGVFNVEGVVKDAAGEPIIGANVVENGTQNGTVSDINGVFTLKVKNGNAVLKVSYIGYVTQTINIKSQSKVNVTFLCNNYSKDNQLQRGGYKPPFPKLLSSNAIKIEK